jgi:hypothetical protein
MCPSGYPPPGLAAAAEGLAEEGGHGDSFYTGVDKLKFVLQGFAELLEGVVTSEGLAD